MVLTNYHNEYWLRRVSKPLRPRIVLPSVPLDLFMAECRNDVFFSRIMKLVEWWLTDLLIDIFRAFFPSEESLWHVQCIWCGFSWDWVIAQWNQFQFGLKLKVLWHKNMILIAMTAHNSTHLIRIYFTGKLNIKVISDLHGNTTRVENILQILFFCNAPTFILTFGFN